MPERVPVHEYVYTVTGNPPSTILTGSTDLEEVRGLIAHTYRVDPGLIQLERTK